MTDAAVVGAYCMRPPGFQKVVVTHGSKWPAGLNERLISRPRPLSAGRSQDPQMAKPKWPLKRCLRIGDACPWWDVADVCKRLSHNSPLRLDSCLRRNGDEEAVFESLISVTFRCWSWPLIIAIPAQAGIQKTWVLTDAPTGPRWSGLSVKKVPLCSKVFPFEPLLRHALQYAPAGGR